MHNTQPTLRELLDDMLQLVRERKVIAVIRDAHLTFVHIEHTDDADVANALTELEIIAAWNQEFLP